MLAPLADSWADVALTVPAARLEHPRTTNGAGDASTAGLLWGLIRGGTPDQATALARACAAAVMSGKRPSPGLVSSIEPATADLFQP